MDDDNSRLPYIPLFFRTLKPEAEEEFLATAVPQME